MLSCFTFSVAAKPLYISELVVISGKEKVSEFEKKGYNILFQRMNLVTDEDSVVYLAYKKGGTAITDMVVSESKAKTLTLESVTYNLVSEISLNEGTEGTPIYLYCTKDEKAGKGISLIDTVSGFSDRDEIIPLLNDGSSPVRTSDGRLANLDQGINNCQLYLVKYSGEDVRPYISDLRIVSGKSKREAVVAAANSGCDFYLDNNLSESDSFSVVAYQRTSDKNEAVTDFILNGTNITVEKNKDSTGFLIDIAESQLFKENFTVSDWAPLFVSASKTMSKNNQQYMALVNNKELCCCVPAGKDLSFYALYLGTYGGKNVSEDPTGAVSEEVSENEETTDEVLNIEKEEQTPVAEESENEEEPTEAVSEEGTDNEEATDEVLNIEKEEQMPVEEEPEHEKNTVSTVLGNGNIWFIVIFSIIIIVLLICLKFIKKGKKRNEKNT